MKRTLVFIFLIFILLLPLSANPWLGGYLLSFDGYGTGALASTDEQFGIHLTLMPVQLGWFTPVASLGVLIPTSQRDVGPLIETSVTLQLFSVTNHLFSPLFRRQSAWQPSVQMSLLNTIRGEAQSTLAWSLHPFVFFFGEKRLSLLAPRLLYEPKKQNFSWGIRLLEVSHALY